MSVGINISFYSGKGNDEFKKHFNAVKFCIDNELPFPKETNEFFKGGLDGESLEDYLPEAVIKMIEKGISIGVPIEGHEYEHKIKMSDIPSCVDEIIVRLC